LLSGWPAGITGAYALRASGHIGTRAMTIPRASGDKYRQCDRAFDEISSVHPAGPILNPIPIMLL
jgi:hypothetical protein